MLHKKVPLVKVRKLRSHVHTPLCVGPLEGRSLKIIHSHFSRPRKEIPGMWENHIILTRSAKVALYDLKGPTL